MNILLFQPHSPKIGGVDTVLLQFIELATDIEPELHFFLIIPPGNPKLSQYRQSGIQVFEVNNLGYFTKHDSIPKIIATFVNMPKAYRIIKRIIIENHIDLVHSHKINSFLGSLAARGAGVKVVHTYHEINTGNLIIYRLFNLLIESIVDRIIILCDATGELISKNWRINPKVNKVYNGINTNYFLPPQERKMHVRQELSIPNHAPVVIAISRIQATKGLEYYIDAANKVIKHNDQVHFLMVGDVAEDEKESLKYKQLLIRQVVDCCIDKNFHFTGIRSNVVDIYSIANVFVLPSIFDIFPTTVLEAMAMQLPVIATKVGGVVEQVVDEQTGYLISQADSDLLSIRIIDLIENPKKSHIMGKLGRKRVIELFSQNNYVSNTMEIYTQLLNNR